MKILSVLVMLALLLSACAPATPSAPVRAPTAGIAPREASAPTGVIPTSPPITPVQTLAGLPTAGATPAVQSSPVYTVTEALGYVDTYFVDPGLDDPTPPLGGRVLVRARLIKNGVRLGGIMARVTWMEGGALQLCDFLPLYQNGCVIEVRDFVPGVWVPVTVTMRYQGMVFTGHSGFTPR